MENLVLESIDVDKNRVKYHFSYSAGLAGYFTTRELFVVYDRDVSHVPEGILAIPFVGSFIALTWVTHSVLWVKDLDLTFYRATSRLKVAYQELYPHYQLGGRLFVARLHEHPALTGTNRSLLLFSGGMDAHTSYIRNRDKELLLCNVQGWYDELNSTDRAAEADFRDILKFAAEEGREHTFIRSNFAKVVHAAYYDRRVGRKIGYGWWYGFLHSMAFISTAIPIAYLGGISEIIIASSFWMNTTGVCASYATTDVEFQFCQTGHVKHDGADLNRQQKAQIIVDYQRRLGRPYPMRVCSFNDHNCCACEKCFRSILNIVAEAADIRDFGFYIDRPLKEHWEDVLQRKGALLDFSYERTLHWVHIIPRMQENYDRMTDQQREFVDWFLSFDFARARRDGLRRYYRQNFFSILRRKARTFITDRRHG